MQAQGSVIQGGMMGNFIQIYQTEGTKGLWKASFMNYFLSYSGEFHIFLQYSLTKYR